MLRKDKIVLSVIDKESKSSTRSHRSSSLTTVTCKDGLKPPPTIVLFLVTILQRMVDCKVFSEQRYKCHAVYGKGGEDCLHQELSEKRCLSLQHCPRQAHEYYGDFPMTSTTLTLEHDAAGSFPPLVHKGMCASWAESFAYADKALEFGSNVAEHHRLANEIVSQDRKLKQECRRIAFTLAQCLRQHKLF